ncbi:MAG: ATP-binding protein, partial [Armatimonadota bacterium]|nr:ATP-binding protein [Armatimonadota bacterium]
RLVTKLFPTFLAISLLCIFLLGGLSVLLLVNYEHHRAQDELLTKAELASHAIRGGHILSNQPALQRTVHELAGISGARITVVDAAGRVLADSEAEPSRMPNHSDRPEIAKALSGEVSISRHRSATLGSYMYYAAVPVERNGRVVAVVRAAQMTKTIDAPAAALGTEVVAVLVAAALLAGVLSLAAAHRMTRPLAELQNAASLLASGDFRTRAPTCEISELASLADSLNTMASKIESQIREIKSQTALQEAILTSMKEAVLAVSEDDTILIANEACRRHLGIDPRLAVGKPLQEVIRRPAVHRFVELVRRGIDPDSDASTFETENGTVLQMSHAVLTDREGRRLGGILIVISDVTEDRRLEQMRRDFVANVSHELKTPLTAIKGCLEALLDMRDLPPEKKEDFLETALRQTDRLNTIIEDLLKLTEIEQKAKEAKIELIPMPVKPVIELAVANLETVALEKSIEIDIQCPEDIAAVANAPLLERAISNLVDNAIKYCPEGSRIHISAERTDSEIVIRVADNGPGIPAEHLPRIFERFYRVDSSRSRRVSGSGLGLAIVKHIAQAHGGRVEASSRVGEGSTFSIYIPAANSSVEANCSTSA